MAAAKKFTAAILARRASKDRAGNARGRGHGSTPLPTWSAHETG
jgi:hypothetical protein